MIYTLLTLFCCFFHLKVQCLCNHVICCCDKVHKLIQTTLASLSELAVRSGTLCTPSVLSEIFFVFFFFSHTKVEVLHCYMLRALYFFFTYNNNMRQCRS